MTQSAVSKSVARLERTLELTLIIRRYREIELTPEGARLYESWRRCIADLNRSYEVVRQSLLDKTRRLRIGATGATDLSFYFWPLVNRFPQEHAQVRLEFDSDSINRLVESCWTSCWI